jgi:thiamine-phosphate pyrophosphorylase
VLLREKDLPRPVRRSIGLEMRKRFAFVLVASDLELAREIEADGVHLAANEPFIGPSSGVRFVSRSCHDANDLEAATQEGCAFATLSPIFTTESKPGYGPAIGISGLAALTHATPHRLPVVALGGVTPTNAKSCMDAGATAVAIMGAIMRHPSPVTVVGEALASLQNTGQTR